MSTVLGELLPIAVAVVLSPAAIIAIILMLLSHDASRAALGFLSGWVAGILLVTSIAVLLATAIPESGSAGSAPLLGLLQIVLGLLTLYLAVAQWRSRPRGDGDAPMPKWMQAIDSMSFRGAAWIALFLTALNIKNLTLLISAGVDIGTADLPLGQTIVCILLFTLVASIGVALPILANALAPELIKAPLESARRWLIKENTGIMMTVLTILGVSMIGKGIGSF